MTNNGKEVSEKSKNGYRKKINRSLYQAMQERNENGKRNGEWQERKKTDNGKDYRAKGKMDVKPLVESPGRRKQMGGCKHYWKNESNEYNMWDRNE